MTGAALAEMQGVTRAVGGRDIITRVSLRIAPAEAIALIIREAVEHDRPVPVGSKQADRPLPQPIQGFRRRVSVTIVDADRDHGILWAYFSQELPLG